MFHVLFKFLFASLIYFAIPVSSASACKMFEDSWTKPGADLSGPCDLGDEPVELALIDYTSIKHGISYRVVWQQDLNNAICSRSLNLTISQNKTQQSYKICNVEFPLDRLTKAQLLKRLTGLMPLFEHGDTDGRLILISIDSEI